MQLGLTWPLQRLLHISAPQGSQIARGLCWDMHCIQLHGRGSLLLVHCESRYTCVRFDLSPLDWNRLQELAAEEIRLGLAEAGIEAWEIEQYLSEAGAMKLTRTHGRREVAFLNRAWEDVLSADLLIDQGTQRQPLLNQEVNSLLCRCAGEEGTAPASAHLKHYFERRAHRYEAGPGSGGAGLYWDL